MTKTWSGARVRRIRAYWAQRIYDAAYAGKPLECYRCPRIDRPPHPLHPGDDFDVDHIEATSAGGPVWSVTNTAPSCAASNRAHGAALTNLARRNSTTRTRPWPT
jgi:hypothetical protein